MVMPRKYKGAVRGVNKLTFRSGLEREVSSHLNSNKIDAPYECYYVPYTKPSTAHKYTPDFILPNGIIIETKGMFSTEDRMKHLLVKEQYPHLDIRFVFTRSKSWLYKGSKTTYGQWCEKNGFLYADKLVPEEWLKERLNKKRQEANKNVLVLKKTGGRLNNDKI